MSDRPSRHSGETLDSRTDPFDALLKRAAQLTPLPRGETPRLLPGVEIWNGRFQVLRRIGSGGMGVVHEVIDRVRGERVALKTLSQLDGSGIYRLKREFRALAEVVHPNLVTLHELFAGDELWLFTMELVAGAPLDRWVRPLGVLDEARLRLALAQLAQGISAIHAAGKLHRDLKPSNVLVTLEQRVVILDFGLVADPEPGGAGQTLDDDRASGTPAYMAPEQAAGEVATAASDWYALGVMLFEALTGALPFTGGAQTLMQRKQVDIAPRASDLARSVPDDLDALCAALLSREPSARPDGAAILALLATSVEGARPAPAATTEGRARLDLVGRDTELASLREAFNVASAGRAALISVSGESGAGKSALVTAFLDELRATERAVILEGRCYEREFVPYKAFDRVIDALTRYLRQLRDVDAASLMPRDIGALARIFPVLDRVEVIAALPARPSADHQELRRRAFDAFAELLGRIRDRHMLVVHIDDAHWIDDDSIRLLEHIVSRPEPIAALFVLGQRLASRDALLERLQRAASAGRSMVFRDIALPALPRDAMRELARRRLGDVEGGDRLADAVAGEAQGSPFFAIELARHALEMRAGRAPAGDKHDEPVSLEHALRTRTEQLGPSARELLELLAIAARPTPFEVLALAAHSTDGPQRALDVLRNAQLVRDAGAGNLECYHDRVRVALVDDVEPVKARAHHARLAEAWATRSDADPEVLFEHYHASEQLTLAGSHAVRAAEKASGSLAFQRSATFLEHAIELLPQSEVERLELRTRRAEALSLCGRWNEAAAAFESAARASHDPAEHSALLRRSALHLLGSGHGQEGLPRLREVFVASGLPWPRTRIGALLGAFVRVAALWWRVRRSSALFEALERDAKQARPANPALEPLLEAAALVPPYELNRGLYFVCLFAWRALSAGRKAEAAVALAMLAALFSTLRATRPLSLRLTEQACTLARSHDVANLATAALTFAAFAQIRNGHVRDALALGAEAERLLLPTQRAHNYELWNARSMQSLALVLMGRVGEAAALLETTARQAREVGDELAIVGGDSPLRHLVVDDLARAKLLLACKQVTLESAGTRGALHQVVVAERMMCALYEGRGGEALDEMQHHSRGLPLTVHDPSVLFACCALQAAPSERAPALRIVQKTLRKLTRAEPSAAVEGMTAQLQAALCVMHADVAGACDHLSRAAERYDRADMALHAALMRYRRGHLQRDAAGSRSAREAERFMRAQGIARPEAWARMLAPGLED